jgi:hypothetical protein
MVSTVELRRALLLFAIVLGLAAIVAAVSGTRSDRTRTSAAVPNSPPGETAHPGPVRQTTLRFDSAGPVVTRTARVDESVTVSVKVDEAGTVELQGLGLSDDAEPLTPAQFDVLADQPGRHAVLLLPPNGVRPRTVGRLVFRPQR